MILVLEEDQLFANDQVISDLSVFLAAVPTDTEITLILKTHKVHYHLAQPSPERRDPIQQAGFPPEYWVGQRILSQGQTFMGGFKPSLFMKQTVHCLAHHPFALKKVLLWTDLVARSYEPLPEGWLLIHQDHHVLICYGGILQASRTSYLPLAQEFPAILRYLRRFGYRENMAVRLITPASPAEGTSAPDVIHQEVRSPAALGSEGLQFRISSLAPLQRLYKWPRKVRTVAWALTLVNSIGILYMGGQSYSLLQASDSLKRLLSEIPVTSPLDEKKMQAFAVYRKLSATCPTPLPLLRRLGSLTKGEAVATHLHWTATPLQLVLHMQLSPALRINSFLSTLQTGFPQHRVSWQEDQEDISKGILVFVAREK